MLLYKEQERDEEHALIAQLGERQTEDLKVLCSIHSQGKVFSKLSNFSEILYREYLIPWTIFRAHVSSKKGLYPLERLKLAELLIKQLNKNVLKTPRVSKRISDFQNESKCY